LGDLQRSACGVTPDKLKNGNPLKKRGYRLKERAITFIYMQICNMKKLISGFCLLLSARFSFAQTDTVSNSKNNLRLEYIKEGTSQFITWDKSAVTGTISRMILWERKVKFIRRDDQDEIAVTQRRLYDDTTANTFVYTVSRRADFQTIYDYRKGKSGIQSFDYKSDKIVGSDTVKNNIKNGFVLSLSEFPYCFELDLETLSMLPIKRVNQRFAINFYHPGGTVPPQYYPVTVIREDVMDGVNGVKIKCWVIRLEYDKSNYDLSWISKDQHEFLKLESHSPTGTYNKVKLSASVNDL
jgi:hypothetical protein